MFDKTSCLFQIAAVAVLASACSATQARPLSAGAAPVTCQGGSISSSTDAARFVGCRSIVGSLTVKGSALADLVPLSTLQSVSGKLTLSGNTQLRSLSGLEQLSHVGALDIQRNPKLRTLSHLESLSAAPHVTIAGNPALKNLRGLERLERAEFFEVRRNGIYSTDGLEGLRSAGVLSITENQRLISLAGLERLERVRTLRIEHNPLICARLGLFSGLTEVTNPIIVRDNRGISTEDVEALRERVKVAGWNSLVLAQEPRPQAALRP